MNKYGDVDTIKKELETQIDIIKKDFRFELSTLTSESESDNKKLMVININILISRTQLRFDSQLFRSQSQIFMHESLNKSEMTQFMKYVKDNITNAQNELQNYLTEIC
jgi:hypothetical protein